MSPAEIRDALASVTNIEEQAMTMESAVVALDDVADPSLVEPVLALFERCGDQDDFGMFSSMISWLETFHGDPAARAAVQASVRRAPSWPTIQILPAFATGDEARAILREVLDGGSFRDARYQRSWLEQRLAELG